MDVGVDLDGGIYRQGYLQRKKGVAKSVKKRWFCLNQDAFITFKSEEDAKRSDECVDVLPLVDIQTVKKQHSSNHKYYPIEVITRQKTNVFLTDSAFEQDQWVKAFHTAMKMRSFQQETAQVTSKYSNGKDRRSSTGAKKLSQIKKYMHDSMRPGQQRKSSGVECDLNETPDYQGIPIGTEHDDVFESSKSTSSSLSAKTPQTVQYVAVHGTTNGSGGGGSSSSGKSRASDDSGQGSHDVRNLDSTSSANTASSDGEIENGASKSVINGTEDSSKSSTSQPLTPPPVPAPASSGLSRSKKQRVFEDEQIYDEPPRIDEDIYDVPPREIDIEYEDEVVKPLEDEDEDDEDDDEEYYPAAGLTKSSAMDNLQKILLEDTDDDDDDLADNGEESECDYATEHNEGDSLEVALTEKGVEKSAVEQLKDLLDSFDEL